ncbi:MAG: glycoside hydrolase family 15 protein [Actinomycetes bacterium]
MTDQLVPPAATALGTERLTWLARRSHEIIAAHQHADGAYPASPTFSAYRGYAWLRDGSFTAEGVSRYGDVESAGRFHDWVGTVLARRRDQVEQLVTERCGGRVPVVEAMLPTRFTLDGRDGSDPWWDFQTDGYGMWLWSVVTHAERHGLDPQCWRTGVEVATDYATAFWDLPCYDWWEEHAEHRHVSTLGALHAGLSAAARSGLLDRGRAERAVHAASAARDLVMTEGLVESTEGPHLAKWIGAEAVDGSLPACIVPFGLLDPADPVAAATLDAVARDLDVDGGVHRYRADVFYGGGQWLLLSCLLGWNRAVAGDRAEGLRYLEWVAGHALASGEMPEQVPDHLLHATSRQEWLDRWGSVATPLLWSHGMYLVLADELDLLPEEALR